MSEDGIALVVGVGPGLGAALCRTFAHAGMPVAMAARDRDKLEPLARELAPAVDARAYDCDATDERDVESLFGRVKADLGEPSLVVYNAGAFVPKPVLETTREEFERCWRVLCEGAFLVGRAAGRLMAARGDGTLLFTGATAALRGSAGFVNLAVGKFGLRALSQSLARELGPRGVHVAHVIVDGQIEAPSQRAPADGPPHSRLDPEAIADTYLMLHRQHRSAWSQEIDLRPWVERF